jgi:hypothetical protein
MNETTDHLDCSDQFGYKYTMYIIKSKVLFRSDVQLFIVDVQ